MNANPKFLAATAQVDAAAIKPLPNSRKVYIGKLRVPACACARSSRPQLQKTIPVAAAVPPLRKFRRVVVVIIGRPSQDSAGVFRRPRRPV